MSRFRRYEIVDHSPPSYYFEKPCISTKTLMLNPYFPSFPIVEDELDLLSFTPSPPLSFFDEFDTITDLIQIQETPFHTSTRRITRRVVPVPDLYLNTLCDRVSALELGFEKLVKEEIRKKNKSVGEKKYTWTAEIKSPEKNQSYKWVAAVKGDSEKKYKWTTEVKGKGGKSPVEQSYTIKVTSGDGEWKKKNKKCEKGKVKGKAVGNGNRIVEIEEANDHGAIVLRQVFAKRVEKRRGKRTEIGPHDAAALIQMSFRAYLIRRSQALRALRELAIAKSKLRELRSLFNNFSYRRRISRDAEERQRFSEKVIVLLLTVDAIEGADHMVRSSKKSMVDELEAMLDVVDPQPTGRSLSMRRRTFDMPDGTMNKELAAGVAQVVRMLDQEATSSEIFEE